MNVKVTINVVRDCFTYQHGKLFWKSRPLHHFKSTHGHAIWNGRYPGKEAGTFSHNRFHVNVFKSPVMRYRVIWALHYGFWPPHEIDHVNHITTDDRIENLRLASPSQNQGNRRKNINSKNPYKGVRKAKARWQASISYNKKRRFLGSFNTPEEAAKAYHDAAVFYYGEFACVEEQAATS